MRLSKFLGFGGPQYTISIARGFHGAPKNSSRIISLNQDSFDTPLDAYGLMSDYPCIIVDDHANKQRYAVCGRRGSGIEEIYKKHTASAVEKTIEFLTTLEPVNITLEDVEERHQKALKRTNAFLERRFGDYGSAREAMDALVRYIDRKFIRDVAIVETDGYGSDIHFKNGHRFTVLHKAINQPQPAATQSPRPQSPSGPGV